MPNPTYLQYTRRTEHEKDSSLNRADFLIVYHSLPLIRAKDHGSGTMVLQ
jgi:hypothetical protein